MSIHAMDKSSANLLRHPMRDDFFFTVLLLGALASSLWAIDTKSGLDLSAKVSLSVGLGVSLPCFVPVGFWISDLFAM